MAFKRSAVRSRLSPPDKARVCDFYVANPCFLIKTLIVNNNFELVSTELSVLYCFHLVVLNMPNSEMMSRNAFINSKSIIKHGEASAIKVYLGIDVGSVSTNIAVIDAQGSVLDTLYIRTQGRPIEAVQKGLKQIYERNPEVIVKGVGTTGSGRKLTGVVVGADCIKNEITAHAVAAMHIVPNVQTILEMGGQDSKLILIRNGVVTDFAMNTVCAAGTGSFLDQQSARLSIPIDQFGDIALEATVPVRIAGRCAVFAESDMIHKQQLGHEMGDSLAGLCAAMVRNYLTNVAKGKQIIPKVFFQGGVAANVGMQRSFMETLGLPVHVPKHYDVMGAIGAAQLAKETLESQGKPTAFCGLELLQSEFSTVSYLCQRCPNQCEIVEIWRDGSFLASWGSRCGRGGCKQDQAT